MTSFVERMAWSHVEARLSQGAAAILPIGAAAKEHGLHLPMNTDAIQARWLSERIAAVRNMLIWPELNYGHYPAFTQFPGSISLSRPLFTSLVEEVVASIVNWSPQALFVLDTGISTLPAVAAAISGTRWNVPVVHLRIHDGIHYRTAAEAIRQQAFGSHADELETSRMLMIAPEVVKMDLAAATPDGPIDGPLTREIAPSGSYGDPTLASAKKGQRLIDAMIEDIMQTINTHLARL